MSLRMLHPQGQPSHFTMSRGLASLGRGNDTQLVHMSNSELAGLKHLAMAHGGQLTVNPHTGLYEAGALDSILPLIAGGILTMSGVGAPAAAAMVGAEEGIRKKSWKAGLAAGLGAYGGAGLAGSLAGAGAAASAGAGADAATTATTGAINPEIMGDPALTATATQGSSAGMTAVQQQALAESAKQASMAGGNAGLGQLQSQWGNVKSGIGTLDSMQGLNNIGSSVGKMGAMEMAAPAMYQASQPAGPSPPTSSRYATTTYDPRTQTYGPLSYHTWTDQGTGSGYASGGFVPAGGGSSTAAPIAQPIEQQAIRDYYNSLMQPPTRQPITPSSPDANNQYMSNLNANLAANPHIGGHPVTPAATPPGGGMTNNPTSPTPATPMPPTPSPPPRMIGGEFDPRMMGIRQFDTGGTTSTYPTYDPATGKMIYPDAPKQPAPNLDNLAHPASFFKDTLEHPFDVMGNIENRPNTAATVLDPLGIIDTDKGSKFINEANLKADFKELPHIASLGLFAQGGIASLQPRHIQGPGDGMSDSIPARIDGKQEAALGNDEFVIPADVVSHIGNGSSDAGAKKLYAMMDRIRQSRTGKKGQAPQINAERLMPR